MLIQNEEREKPMITTEVKVTRVVKLPFIGERKQTVPITRKEYESWKEAISAVNEMEEADQSSALRDLNNGIFSNLRSKAYASAGGTGRNSVVGACRKVIQSYMVANPDAPEQEAAEFALSIPNMRTRLEAAGIDLESKVEDSDEDEEGDDGVEVEETA